MCRAQEGHTTLCVFTQEGHHIRGCPDNHPKNLLRPTCAFKCQNIKEQKIQDSTPDGNYHYDLIMLSPLKLR